MVTPSLRNPSSSDSSDDVANTSVFRSFLRMGSDDVIFFVCWSFGQLEAFVRSVFVVSYGEPSGGEYKPGLRFRCKSSYPELGFVRPLASIPSSHRLWGAIDADLLSASSLDFVSRLSPGFVSSLPCEFSSSYFFTSELFASGPTTWAPL